MAACWSGQVVVVESCQSLLKKLQVIKKAMTAQCIRALAWFIQKSYHIHVSGAYSKQRSNRNLYQFGKKHELVFFTLAI
jgi:hypothetical protein